jgi:trehalose synthase-fused probable maltokinase
MLPIDDRKLAEWLARQRWFGGKGARIASVRHLDSAQISPGLLLAAVEVAYEGGRPPERYAVALRPWSGDGEIVEGLDDDGARALLGIVRGRLRVATAAGALRGERLDAGDSPLDRLSPVPRVRRLSAEQSNTSIVFDDRVILKLIRKLETGVNPELEMGAFLARHGFAATPQLAGAISVEGALQATVAVAHRFVHVESDGWKYVLDAFRRETVPGDALLGEIRELGARVGEMHAALASDAQDPAFAPEPIRREDLLRWSAALRDDLVRTVAAAGDALPSLAEQQPALERRIARLADLPPSGVRIRQHGDLHLGQVLRSDGRWLIFDFEGEPARGFAERRAKHCPFKDVAGMLRSFAYAEGAAEREGAPKGDRKAKAREAFLAGWRSAAGHLAPQDPAAASALLDALELEKLLYEVRYELGHRPDWVSIPAKDLEREARA